MSLDWIAALDRLNGAAQAAFGEPVSYAPATGEMPYDITGIFDEAFLELVVVDGVQLQTEQPTLGIQYSQFTAQFKAFPVQGDQLTVMRTGETFVVREPRPDGHGGGRLMLNYVSETNG
ncbi:head-tail joining protein [Caballeronia sordidicola]|uniref:Phage protein n=1 Tax=Caballeronia sordidicola TaxID=196367 RepID=A0A242N780_CABSO|nr:hypothetical protein [Caballeronia sordidicola]OTP79488.1 hypothetical protein PAMC26577_01075 [Caballeronia sordidicola]